MFTDYTTILEAHGSALHDEEDGNTPIICTRAGPKKDCNNGDNNLTYDQRGYEVVVL